MRLILAMVLAGLAASPLSVSAQAEEGTEPNVEEPAPPSEPAPEEPAPQEPALELKLDDVGLGFGSPSPRHGYQTNMLEEVDLRLKRARIAAGVSGVATSVGFLMTLIGATTYEPVSLDDDSGSSPAVMWTGVALLTGGLFVLIPAGVALRESRRRLERLQDTQHGEPRRAQWDLARSRLVF